MGAGFGLPNRRKRVFVLASLHGDARDVLLSQVCTRWGCTPSAQMQILLTQFALLLLAKWLHPGLHPGLHPRWPPASPSCPAAPGCTDTKGVSCLALLRHFVCCMSVAARTLQYIDAGCVRHGLCLGVSEHACNFSLVWLATQKQTQA